jgi:hypothetical protein
MAKKIIRLTEQDLINVVNRVLKGKPELSSREYDGTHTSEDVKKLLLRNGFKLFPKVSGVAGSSGWIVDKGTFVIDMGGGMKATKGMYRAEIPFEGVGVTLIDHSKGQRVSLPDREFKDNEIYTISYGSVDKKGNFLDDDKDAKMYGSGIWRLCQTFGIGSAEPLFTKIKREELN